MSLKAINWALEQEGLTTAEKFVLVVIAHHFNDQKANAYPGRSTIARKAAITERTVGYALNALEDNGLIRRIGRGQASGHRGTTIYKLPMYLDEANGN